MKFETAYITDIGKKTTNQDALLIKEIQTPEGNMLFASICDGMGGIQKGEFASSEVIHAFDHWFQNEVHIIIETGAFSEERLFYEWENVIQRMNSYLIAYGRQNNIQLGTTLAGLLLFRDKYYTVNVGDSRIYEVAELGMQCLTKDQSLVMWEVEQGRLSPEELEHDPRRNILLQCIGASGTVQPDYSSGKLEYDAVYMLCCDGFRHEIQPKEFYELLRPSAQKDGKMLQEHLNQLLEMNLSRNESDNITAIGIRFAK